MAPNNTNKPLFSVITPVHNCAEYIEGTLKSVLTTASEFSFEYIVVNDGSTDETASILDQYSSEIIVITTLNSGESSAVNVGINSAKGEYILVVSADDPLYTNKLFQDVHKIFCANPTVNVLYPDWRIINSNGELVKEISVPSFSLDLLIGENNTLPGPGTFFRSETARAIGGRNARWKFVGDFDFWLRMSMVGGFLHRPETLAQWRQHQNSTSVARRGLEMAMERIDVIDEFLSGYPVETKLGRKARSSSYYLAARLSYFDSRIPGRQLMLRSITTRRSWPTQMKLKEFIYLLGLPVTRKMLNVIRFFPRVLRGQ